MRLTRLQLSNYKQFERLDLTIEPAMLLVGANDAGKSTIIEALHRVLRTSTGGFGSPGWWEHVAPRHGAAPHTIVDVSVVATFGELTPNELSVASPVIASKEELRLGRYWRPLGESDEDVLEDELCFVLDHRQRDRIASVLDEVGPSGDGPSERFLGLVEAIGDDSWIGLSSIDDVFRESRHRFPEIVFHAPRVVHVPGPEEPVPAPTSLLLPLIRDEVLQQVALAGFEVRAGAGSKWVEPGGGVFDELYGLTRQVLGRVSEAYAEATPRYLGEYRSASVTQPRNDGFQARDRAIDALIGELTVKLVGRDEPDGPDRSEADAALGGPALDSRGAGTRRRALLAALDLYGRRDLWMPDETVVVTIEEPEIGLHPGAQRQVAEALAGLPTNGLQVMAVSHSPTFIQHFPAEGLRLVRRVTSGRHSESVVVLPERLREITTDLGVDPSDVLLARRFVVVEGTSDVAILREWARALGIDLERSGIQFIAAGGHSRASNLAQFLEVAYTGSTFHVLLDGGAQTDESLRQLQADFGDRIEVSRLEEDQIEAYFTAKVVCAWLLATAPAMTPQDLVEADAMLSEGVTKAKVQALTQRYLGRTYKVSRDGASIARLTQEQDLQLEVRERLLDACGVSPGGSSVDER